MKNKAVIEKLLDKSGIKYNKLSRNGITSTLLLESGVAINIDDDGLIESIDKEDRVALNTIYKVVSYEDPERPLVYCETTDLELANNVFNRVKQHDSYNHLVLETKELAIGVPLLTYLFFDDGVDLSINVEPGDSDFQSGWSDVACFIIKAHTLKEALVFLDEEQYRERIT